MNTIKIILKDKEYEIPSNFRYFNDVDPNIRQQLLTNNRYIVQSNVHNEILNSFIKYWINKEIPEFTTDNLSEYDQLSQEFDLMKDIILIYKQLTKQIQIKETQNEQLIMKADESTIIYQKIIDILLNNPINSQIKNKLFNAIQDQNIEKIKFYTKQTYSNDMFLFTLNEDDQTAGILLCYKQKKIIQIPDSIDFLFSQYDVTVIHEEAFKKLLGFNAVIFSNNSKLNEIQNYAFYMSGIKIIRIPKSVKKIGQRAFSYCNCLEKIDFEPNSKLNYIGESAFEGCGIKYLSIPSNYIQFNENWCFWIHEANIINVSPSEQNCICVYKNQFLLMKSDPKSDIFDTLLFSVRNIKNATIPPFVKKVSELAFSCCSKLEKVEFPIDSEIKIIGKNAFSESSIKHLIIPSSIEKFEDGWCNETQNFEDIKIIPNEKENIICYQNKFILGKSDLDSDNFDILYFASRDIEDAEIPSNIKIIGSNAFDYCPIQKITFSEDSSLVSIGNCAFQYSDLTSISIPSGVTTINRNTFYECINLNQFEIPINSELCVFGESSLYCASIKSLYIPSKVVEFQSEWCDNTKYLTDIVVSPNNKNFMFLDNCFLVGKSDPSNLNYDVLVFARRDVRAPVIPSFIRCIASCAFNFCEKLETVHFANDSKLEIIQEDAFSCSSIQRIKFPSSLKIIRYSGFDECSNLKIVEFEDNCQLRSIENMAFHNDPIRSLVFPPHLRKIENEVFHWTEIQIIEISEDSEMCSFSFSIFVAKYPDLVMVPSKIRNDFKFY